MLLDHDKRLQRAIARAEEQDADRRDLAFLAPAITIARLPCLPLTPRMMLCLYLAKSPFLCGGTPGGEHVAQFLWIVSPQFRLGDRAAAVAFARRIGQRVPYVATVRKIDAVVADALRDRPARSAGKGIAIASWVAALIHLFAFHYHWGKDEVLDTPIAQLLQLKRHIDRELNPNLPPFGGVADRVKGAWLRRRAERRAKKGAAK